VKEALKNWRAWIWGTLAILLITPVIGIKLSSLLPVNGNNTLTNDTVETAIGPPEFRIGFQLFCVAPCTISSGIVMVSQLQGDYALAVLLTVLTNVVSVFTVSPLLSLLASFGTHVTLDVGEILLKLLLTVLLPVIVGKAFSFSKKVKQVVKRFDTSLKIVSMTALILIPWMKVSKARKDGSFDGLLALNIVSSIGFALALHAAFLLTNVVASVTLCLSKESRKAIIILASQKTLAISVSVLLYLPSDAGDKGLMTLPIIVSHLTQIIADAVIVSLWLRFETTLVQPEEHEMEERTTTGYQLEDESAICETELDYEGKESVTELTELNSKEQPDTQISNDSEEAKLLDYDESSSEKRDFT
jgi:sodium/bile acid cotransporter 7